jgi:hypothetical protein
MQLPTFDPVDRPLHLTKEKAAARQAQLAISALLAGDYDAAITLAGAAEEMLTGDPGVEVTTQAMAPPKGAEELAPYKWPEIVNLERNWLKHRTATEKIPPEITLDLDNAPFYVFRAIRKLPLALISPEMIAFDEWYRGRITTKRQTRENPPR